LYQYFLNRRDLYIKILLGASGFICSLCVILIFLFLLKESFLVITGQELSLFFQKSWFPLEGQFNLIPILIASVLLTFGSIFLALPLGLLTAILERFFLKGLFKIIFRRIIEIYTGIPSVIFGFWGLMKLVPFINDFHPPGQSLLSGILILSLMIFPIISLNIMASVEMSPKHFYRVSESLGISRATYIWKILLPSLKGQIFSSSLLAIGRALGETMAVLMVCGNIVQVPGHLFDPVRSLTANIALEMSYATGEHRSALFLSGLVLFLLTLFLYMLSSFAEVERNE